MTAQKITFFLLVSCFCLFANPVFAAEPVSCKDIEVGDRNDLESLKKYLEELKEKKEAIITTAGIGYDDRFRAFVENCDTQIKLYTNILQDIASSAESSSSDNADSNHKCSILDDEKLNKLSKEDLVREIENVDRKIERLNRVTGNQGGTAQQADVEENCNIQKSRYKEAKRVLEKCSESVGKMKESQTDFRKSCGAFSGGTTGCSYAIDACDKCPDEENFGEYDCVFIHKKTKCPALSGKALEEAKEKRKELEEGITEMKEDINEGEKDILSKEGEIKDALAEIEQEFIQLTRELERETEEHKNDLEEGLKKEKIQIEESLAKQMAKAQKQIDVALKISHDFENAIYKANKEYRKERRQIAMECERQAKADLAKYRARRRAAVVTGSLSFSLSSFLKKGRMSFAQKDNILFQQYANRCLVRRKEDFNEALEDHRQKLRMIEQQKEQYLDVLARQKKQLAGLNQKAAEAGNTLLKEYTKQMSKILEAHNKQYRQALQDYNKQKQQIASQTKNISLLQMQLRRKTHDLKSKKDTMLREGEIIDYLKGRGVSDDEDSDAKSEFAEAYDHREEFSGNADIAYADCSCPDKAGPNKSICNGIDEAKQTIETEEDVSNTNSKHFRDQTGGNQ